MNSTGDKDRVRLTRDEVVMGFVASCVEGVADKLSVDYLEVYSRMKAVGLIENYIIPHYEVLHSESRENVTEGIINTLLKWEGKL